jgi:hypothetical protein
MKHVSVVAGKTLPGVCTRFETRTVIWRTAVWRTAVPALFLALACVFTGCESDEDADADKNGAGDGGAASAEAGTDAGGEPGDGRISLSWMVRQRGESLSGFLQWPGLEGVEVCLIESVKIPCVYTDEEGFFVLSGVPANSELLLTFTREGYLSSLVSVKTGPISIDRPPVFGTSMLEKGRFDEAFDTPGVAVDQSKGAIGVSAMTFAGPIFSRLSISIEPPAGDGPFFLDNYFQIVSGATALSGETPAAIFINLEEGEYVIPWEIEEPEEMSCGLSGNETVGMTNGLLAEHPDAVRVKVRPGFHSGQNVIICSDVAGPDTDAGV